jgi:hypothetical protein
MPEDAYVIATNLLEGSTKAEKILLDTMRRSPGENPVEDVLKDARVSHFSSVAPTLLRDFIRARELTDASDSRLNSTLPKRKGTASDVRGEVDCLLLRAFQKRADPVTARLPVPTSKSDESLPIKESELQAIFEEACDNQAQDEDRIDAIKDNVQRDEVMNVGEDFGALEQGVRQVENRDKEIDDIDDGDNIADLVLGMDREAEQLLLTKMKKPLTCERDAIGDAKVSHFFALPKDLLKYCIMARDKQAFADEQNLPTTDHMEDRASLGSTKILPFSKYQYFARGVIYQWSLLVQNLPFPISLVPCCII